ncbi:hypothetical protein WKI68_42520 [Streptomyces sp. MS1.HAVA.3]|uniref:Uncharacterized protein n=1 Tax=Streptomyces caledonius TaxID=3134107 RepID=A0ABU8UDY9_9ACTN
MSDDARIRHLTAAAARQAGASFALVHMDAPTGIRLFDLTEAGPLLGLGLAAA